MATPLRRHPKDRVPTSRISSRHPDGPGQRRLLRSLNTNVMVVDDLVWTTAKDQRINDLFTEGCHHRNLSVIALNQNMYFSKDPTQRRNCQHLVLFKNPIDRLPITTLGRQIYPGWANDFLQKFEEVTKEPWSWI